jgi:hypothetical protein
MKPSPITRGAFTALDVRIPSEGEEEPWIADQRKGPKRSRSAPTSFIRRTRGRRRAGRQTGAVLRSYLMEYDDPLSQAPDADLSPDFVHPSVQQCVRNVQALIEKKMKPDYVPDELHGLESQYSYDFFFFVLWSRKRDYCQLSNFILRYCQLITRSN